MRLRHLSLRARLLLGLVGVAGAFGLWQAAVSLGWLPGEAVPAPGPVLAEFAGQFAQSSFWLAVWQTMRVTLLGLVIITVLASVLALLIGLIPAVRESTWFLIEFLKPIPPVAVIPLGLLLWGPTDQLKLVLVVFGALWPMLTQLVYAVEQVDAVGLDMARTYRLGFWRTTSRLILPSTLPFALTGLRVSAAIAIIITLVTEMIGGAEGLGQQIVVAQSSGALASMYALIITAGLLGLGLNAAFRAAERPLLFWHPSVRKERAA